MRASLQRDVRVADDLRPFRGFIGHEFSELCNRHRLRLTAEILDTLLDLFPGQIMLERLLGKLNNFIIGGVGNNIITAGNGRVAEAPGGWTYVYADQPARLRITARFSLARLLG